MFRISSNGRWIGHLAPVLAVGIIGVAVSIAVWYLTLNSENRAFEQAFSSRAYNQSIVLQNGIDDSWALLSDVRALFEASSDVTREEFESFGNFLLRSRPAILNIAWLPRITREERAAHEAAGARDGLSDYRIRAIVPDGNLPVSPEQDEYFPKFFSTEPRTSPVYGLDLNDGGMRAGVIARIRDGDLLSTSSPLTLYIGQGNRQGFWAALPVYARGLPHETVEDRRRNLRGVVQCVFQIDVLFDAIASAVKTPVQLYLFTPESTIFDRSIYSASRAGTGPIEPKSQGQLAASLHRSFPLNFGDVQWTVFVVPEPAHLPLSGHQSSSIVLISGLLLSGCLTVFVWAGRRNARKLAVANDRFQEKNLQFDAALNNMTQGLLMYNRAGKLVTFNRRFATLVGIPQEQWEALALGITVFQTFELVYELTDVAVNNQTQAITDFQSLLEQKIAGTIVLDRSDGRKLSASCAPMADGGVVITFDDITERRRAEIKISHMAHHDALTDLANRVLLYKKMDKLLAPGPRNKAFAVLCLDLDRFKSVNDTLGHPIGDRLLQAIAGRMLSCVREDDVVARLGGDEFVILQSAFDSPADAASLAKRLIKAMTAPYRIDGHQIVVGTSVGIALAPADGATSDQLMKNADLALYRCKAGGGNRYEFFETKMNMRREAPRAGKADLRKALVRNAG